MMNNYEPLPPLIPDALIKRASKLSPANLCDGMNGLGLLRDGCMDADIVPIRDSMKMIGTACTVSTELGDNLPIHVAIYGCKPGYVLVVAGQGYTERAYMGDLMGGAAAAIGINGIAVDGYVRDKVGLAELGMPIFSRGFMQRSPMKKGPGTINHPAVCGGVPVKPGDLVFGDYDGVTVVPQDRIEEVLERAEKKAAYEGGGRDSIAEYKACRLEGRALPDLTPGWVKEMLEQQEGS